MSTFIRDLLRRHVARMEDHTEYDAVPSGWHALVAVLFRDMAEVLERYADARLQVYQVKEKRGSLRVYVHAQGGTEGNAALLAIVPLISAAEAKSALTCQVCGIPGLSHRQGGRIATLCDVHKGQPAPPPTQDDEDEGWHSSWLSAVQGSMAGDQPMSSGPSPGGPASDAAVQAETRSRGTFKLYDLSAVAAALGPPATAANQVAGSDRPETEYEARVGAILRQGEAGTWRHLAQPSPACLARLDALDAAAPHMGEVTALIRRHIRAALAVGLHVRLPAIMMLGEPGLGKTWYMSRLGAALGLPVRTYPMSASTLDHGLQGAAPSWRNASMGLVAKTLLQEQAANVLILVDEIDKADGHLSSDPYRPFYALLEPSGARTFRDEYLGFEIDASQVSWLLAGNSTQPLPEPILDRLIVLEIPPISREQLAAVAASIYAEANAGMRDFFEPELREDVIGTLVLLTPRAMRLAVQDAMVRAAAEGRRRLTAGDLGHQRRKGRSKFGFRLGQP